MPKGDPKDDDPDQIIVNSRVHFFDDQTNLYAIAERVAGPTTGTYFERWVLKDGTTLNAPPSQPNEVTTAVTVGAPGDEAEFFTHVKSMFPGISLNNLHYFVHTIATGVVT